MGDRMTTSIETLKKRRDELQKTLDTGANRVRRGENDTFFRSLEDIKAILADLDAQIAAAEGDPVPIKRLYITGGKGL